MADISKIKLPDGTTYNIKDETARGYVTGVKGNAESSYRTGQVNLTPANIGAIKISEDSNTLQLLRPSGLRGSGDVTLQGVFNVTRANRLAYLPADQIIIEKTTDGGSTWVDAGYTDLQKRHLFAETRGANINLPKIDNKMDLRCGLRITISAMKYNVPSGTAETAKYNYWSSTYVASQERYSQLKELYFWVSTSNNTMRLKVERATGANPNSWQTCFEDNSYFMAGWSGSDYVRLSYQSTFGGGTNQTGNHWNYRMTFMTRGVNGTDTMGTGYETQTQTLYEIRGYGDSVWGIPNQYMAYDRIYTQNVDKDVTFPSKVTASGGFVGALTGNVTGTATNVTGTVAVANGGTGKTTAQEAANSLLGALDNSAAQSTNFTDNTGIITTNTSGTTGTYYHRKALLMWNYIKDKISSVLGLTVTNYGGTSAKATADASGNTITSYYAPKSTAVTNVALATNKITKTINGSTTDVVTAATTSAYGITKLNSATNSTSTTEAATPSAVKTAYDLANGANTTANTALSGVNGTLIYDHTYTISNGVATFTPHVYLKGSEVTTNYAKSCFVWKYKLASNMSSTPSYVTLTTNNDRTCTVNISTLGYGGYVLGEFTPA